MHAHKLHTIIRAIELHGKPIIVQREQLDQYKENTGRKTVYQGCGLYHLSPVYISISVADKGGVEEPRKPMALIPYTTAVQAGDIVIMDGREYRVGGITDYGQLHIALDLSLREV